MRQPNYMCSNCKDAIRGFQIKHNPMLCPLTAASYCGICATYGHTTLLCPDGDIIQHRKPEFIEQLIPTNLIDTYGIDTMTPLVNKDASIKCAYEPVLEVYDTDQNIRATLMRHGKQVGNKMKENRVRLQKLADELKRKLLYIPSTNKKVLA